MEKKTNVSLILIDIFSQDNMDLYYQEYNPIFWLTSIPRIETFYVSDAIEKLNINKITMYEHFSF